MRLRPWVAALAGPVLCVLSAAAASPPPQDAVEAAAERCLAAFEAREEAVLREIGTRGGVDPARVVFSLLRRDRKARLEGRECPGALDAAAIVAGAAVPVAAGPGLGEAVRRRREAGPEELAREERMAKGETGLLQALAAGDGEAAAAAIRDLDPDLAVSSFSPVAAMAAYDRAAHFETLGKGTEAREGFEDAMRRSREIGWVRSLSDCRHRLAVVLAREGNLEGAEALYREELEERTGAGDERGRNLARLYLGTVKGRRGEVLQARDLIRGTMDFFRGAGLKDEQSVAEYSLGALSREAGRLGEARRHFRESLRLALEISRPEMIADARANLALVDAGTGDFARALDALAPMRAFHRSRRDPAAATAALAQMAGVHASIGDWDSASAEYEEAMGEFRARGAAFDAMVQARGLAAVERARGRGERALEILRTAVADAEAMGTTFNVGKALTDVSLLLTELGRGEEALAAAGKALAILAGGGTRAGILHGRLATAAALERLGRGEEARGAIDLVCAEADGVEDPVLRSAALVLRARLRLAAGDPAGAEADAREALQGRLRLEGGLGETESMGLRETAREASDRGLRAILAGDGAGGKPLPPSAAASASWFAEGGRAMALAGVVGNREALLAASVSAEALDEEGTALLRLAEKRAILVRLASAASPSREAVEGARRALTEAEGGFRAARARMERESRRAAGIALPAPRSLPGIVAALGSGEALLLYQVDARDGRLLALLLSGRGAWLRDLGPAAAVLGDAEGWLRAASAEGGDEEGAARSLYDALLRPLEPHLEGTTRLLVSPDAALSFLPFGALLRSGEAGGRRALERFEISCVPSGTVLADLREEVRGRPPGVGALGLGDPVYGPVGPGGPPVAAARTRGDLYRFGTMERIPATGDEARSVVARYPADRSRLLVRGEATLKRFAAALAGIAGRLAVVHLACHARVDPEHPALTGLALGGGEILDVPTLCGMRLPADLVVLSACETGRGRRARGEGGMGLVRGVFFAGSPRVVVSEWRIPDEGTRILMDRFYDALRGKGFAPAAALRAAQLSLLREGGPRSHPFHWAGFVLWGIPD